MTSHVSPMLFSKSSVYFYTYTSLLRETKLVSVVSWRSTKAKLSWDPGILQASTLRKPKTPLKNEICRALSPAYQPLSLRGPGECIFKQLNIAGAVLAASEAICYCLNVTCPTGSCVCTLRPQLVTVFLKFVENLGWTKPNGSRERQGLRIYSGPVLPPSPFLWTAKAVDVASCLRFLPPYFPPTKDVLLSQNVIEKQKRNKTKKRFHSLIWLCQVSCHKKGNHCPIHQASSSQIFFKPLSPPSPWQFE